MRKPTKAPHLNPWQATAKAILTGDTSTHAGRMQIVWRIDALLTFQQTQQHMQMFGMGGFGSWTPVVDDEALALSFLFMQHIEGDKA